MSEQYRMRANREICGTPRLPRYRDFQGKPAGLPFFCAPVSCKTFLHAGSCKTPQDRYLWERCSVLSADTEDIGRPCAYRNQITELLSGLGGDWRSVGPRGCR